MNKFISLLMIFSLLFPQEVCEGECYTDEEAQNIELYITELEQKSSSDSLVIGNLQEQIQLYLQQTNIDSTIIENYIEQLKLKEDYIKELKPKWYDNKYLWYTLGVASMIVPIWGIGQIK
jgi:excinuclease UvrABC nuclease subunit